MEIKEKVIELLKGDKNVGLDFNKLKTDYSLNDQGMDSLGKMTLFFGIEEEFNIEVPDEEVDSVDTIDEIVKLVESKL
ncbi:acyl carrier protein [Maribellus mangrovi]|uniref:acyl carrier protein n=1 Tax=Maribellus mangrovi TaxID=3133146 RepID=UPI0030ED6022